MEDEPAPKAGDDMGAAQREQAEVNGADQEHETACQEEKPVPLECPGREQEDRKSGQRIAKWHRQRQQKQYLKVYPYEEKRISSGT